MCAKTCPSSELLIVSFRWLFMFVMLFLFVAVISTVRLSGRDCSLIVYGSYRQKSVLVDVLQNCNSAAFIYCVSRGGLWGPPNRDTLG